MRAKKQAPTGQQPQQTFLKLLTTYKRKCQILGISPSPPLKQTLQKSLQTLKLEHIKIAEVIGPTQARALMESINDVKYGKIRTMEIWKSKIGDQGVRNICRYLEQREGNVLEVLDVLENQITSLGCQFLGKTLGLPHTRIKYLKLDDNLIGNKGLQNLSLGLRTNPNLTKLSLKYCGIDQKGVKYLQDILANIHSKIRSIKLQGNPLRNEGVFQFLRVVELNQVLEKVNIADTGLNLLDFVAQNLYVVDQNFVEEEGEEEEDQENPEKGEKGEKAQKGEKGEKREQTPASNIENVKQVLLPQPKIKQQGSKQKVGVLKQLKTQKKQHLKVTKTINENDHSLSAKILKLLGSIMRQNLLIRKYDLRFNLISDDAAIILFEIIQQNSQIKDVEFNTNVDNALRENLDTLMRKRTGRLPKGRTRVSKGKKKKK